MPHRFSLSIRTHPSLLVVVCFDQAWDFLVKRSALLCPIKLSLIALVPCGVEVPTYTSNYPNWRDRVSSCIKPVIRINWGATGPMWTYSYTCDAQVACQ